MGRDLEVIERAHTSLREEHFQREQHVQRSCGENKSGMFMSSNRARNIRGREQGGEHGEIKKVREPEGVALRPQGPGLWPAS